MKERHDAEASTGVNCMCTPPIGGRNVNARCYVAVGFYCQALIDGISRSSMQTPTNLALLSQLDDGYPDEDSVGMPLASLGSAELDTIADLVNKRLCVITIGWEDAFWARLTAAGREALAPSRDMEGTA